jgi:hypothetical protein
MICPNCNTELETLVRVLYPVEQRDEVRLLGSVAEGGLRVEFTGEMELAEGPDTQQGLECPHCQHEVAGLSADALEFVDIPTPLCERVELHGESSEARGRNGWFTPAEVSVMRSEADGSVSISVRSRRPFGDMPPIFMRLAIGDARLLHGALGRQLTALGRETDQEGD